VIVQPDFLTHWKTRKLIRLLKDEAAPLYVIRIWALCQTSKTDVLPANANTLAAICEYDGDSNLLRKSLLDCGFLESQKNGSYLVHGWAELNRGLLHNWSAGKKGGRPSLSASNKVPSKTDLATTSKDPIESRAQKPLENPRDTKTKPKENPVVTDRVDRSDRPDQIRPDGLDGLDQTRPEGIRGEIEKSLGSIFKSSGGVVPVNSLSFRGQGYSRGEMVKHACTGSKRGDVRAKDVFEKIEVVSDFEALKICDEVNAMRMDDHKAPGYLVGVFRKKLFIT
jgi:hypothetical protein